MTFIQALRAALSEEMRRDPQVFVMGEDVRAGTFAVTTGLVDEFGPERVRNTPISEAGFTGLAVGAAMIGYRPYVELTIASFCYVAMDMIVNQAAKNRFLFGGQAKVPAVFRFVEFSRSYAAAQHTDRPHSLFMAIPGLKIIAPTTPRDAKGLLKTAIRDDDPAVMFDDSTFWTRRGEVPEGDYTIPIGRASIAREGRDVTLVAIFTLYPALAAAEELEKEGVSVEVIDPLTLVPLDTETILASVAKTGRLVVSDMAHRTCSAASEVAALVAERGFRSLRAPIRRVCTPDVHIPYSPPLERQIYPDKDKLVAAVRDVLSA
ncbi:MAG: alpha-ketoacid dehydrogenase subunit beta [Chloroflexi bacterium]|nr:alpha-ketoacid dehydrogenase subunit beta [Chloroflexota bacterium]